MALRHGGRVSLMGGQREMGIPYNEGYALEFGTQWDMGV